MDKGGEILWDTILKNRLRLKEQVKISQKKIKIGWVGIMLNRFLNFRDLKLFVWKSEVMGLEKMAGCPLSDFTLGLLCFLTLRKGVMSMLTSCKEPNDPNGEETVMQS